MQTIFTTAMLPLSPETNDRVLGLLPFSHIFGLVLVLLHPLTQQVPIITLPRFTPLTFFTAIQQYRITWSFIVPPLVNLLAHYSSLGKWDLSSLRGMLSGAAPMSSHVAEKAMDRIASITQRDEFMITQGYGLTETSPATHFLPLEDAKRKIGSIGLLLPTVEARIVQPVSEDERAHDGGQVDVVDVPEGEVGELVVRGPTVMK